ncbi:hypothetical protein CPB85DRAFT_1439138 [Mucidula mucida]|nr:hypothetical protein CPB85DRAFT_1439138 [Mucidula mucida]
MSGIFPGGDLPTADETLALASTRAAIAAFDSLACLSSFFMGLFLLTARLNPQIHRSRAWYIMFTTLAVFPLLYLTNAPYQFQSKDPPFGLCLFQAALIYAGPPTSTLAVLCYMLDVRSHFSVHMAMSEKTRTRSDLSFRVLSWLPSGYVRTRLHYRYHGCNVNGERGVLIRHVCSAGQALVRSTSLSILSLAGMLIVEMWIIVMLVKTWRNSLLRHGNTRSLQLSVAIRFGVFTLLVAVAGGLTAFIIPEDSYTGAIWNIFLIRAHSKVAVYAPDVNISILAPFIGGLALGTHRVEWENH